MWGWLNTLAEHRDVLEPYFEYRKLSLDLFTRQLITHGAYFFASVTATVTILSRAKEIWNVWFLMTVLTVLLAIDSYLLFRLFYYSMIANGLARMDFN